MMYRVYQEYKPTRYLQVDSYLEPEFAWFNMFLKVREYIRDWDDEQNRFKIWLEYVRI